MYIFDYNYRLNKIDNILNYYSKNNVSKFIILSIIHYSLLFVLMFYSIFFVKNKYIFLIAYFILIAQIMLNMYDNGCIFMKLERKYIGKWWFGPYTLLNIAGNNIINEKNCSILFKFLSYFALLFGFLRLNSNDIAW